MLRSEGKTRMPGQRPQRHTRSSAATREKEGPGDVRGHKAKKKANFFKMKELIMLNG